MFHLSDKTNISNINKWVTSTNGRGVSHINNFRKMIKFSAFLSWVIILISINISNCLECYVCDNQENNAEKCLNTIKTCEQEEDVCLSEISWGSTPYWTFGAGKQYYVSKRCSTKDRCTRYRNSIMPLCTHIWYQDWKCSECCKGDRCNYYIISGAEHINIPVLSLLSSLTFLIFTNKLIL